MKLINMKKYIEIAIKTWFPKVKKVLPYQLYWC